MSSQKSIVCCDSYQRHKQAVVKKRDAQSLKEPIPKMQSPVTIAVHIIVYGSDRQFNMEQTEQFC